MLFLPKKSTFALIAASLVAVLCFSGTTFAQFTQTNLVSDVPGAAAFTDAHLVNAWGLSYSPTGPFWVSNAGTDTSTLYTGDGTPQALVVAIPGPSPAPAVPTGQLFNGTTDFVITKGTKSAAALFIFAGATGTISGWNPTVDPTNAVIAVNNSGSGAGYTGITSAVKDGANFLYAANFAAGTVDVFDGTFHLVNSFTDSGLPADYAPFNVRNLQGKLYVTFALRGDNGRDEEGPGLGFVDVFDLDGTLLHHIARRGVLNAPWGIEKAPATFGKFGNALLIGNFGDGVINAYNPRNGQFLGHLLDTNGKKIVIDGLWSILFGNGGSAGLKSELFFTAGPEEEAHGLFGKLTLENSSLSK